jgi:hypothetical protein
MATRRRVPRAISEGDQPGRRRAHRTARRPRAATPPPTVDAGVAPVANTSSAAMRMSVLGDALKTLSNAEKRGKRQVLLRPSSKVIIKVLQVMQSHGTWRAAASPGRRAAQRSAQAEVIQLCFASKVIRCRRDAIRRRPGADAHSCRCPVLLCDAQDTLASSSTSTTTAPAKSSSTSSGGSTSAASFPRGSMLHCPRLRTGSPTCCLRDSLAT